MQKCFYDIQAQRKQYGFRHRSTSTIHVTIGDNLMKVNMEVSNENGMFKLANKSKVLVGCIRTRTRKNTIFVG